MKITDGSFNASTVGFEHANTAIHVTDRYYREKVCSPVSWELQRNWWPLLPLHQPPPLQSCDYWRSPRYSMRSLAKALALNSPTHTYIQFKHIMLTIYTEYILHRVCGWPYMVLRWAAAHVFWICTEQDAPNHRLNMYIYTHLFIYMYVYICMYIIYINNTHTHTMHTAKCDLSLCLMYFSWNRSVFLITQQC